MIRNFLRIVKSNLVDILKIKDFIKERRIKRSETKTIVYLAQYIPAWNKFEPIYNELIKRKNVRVFLLCVPSGIQNSEMEDMKELTNDTYEYFVSLGYENCINALMDKTTWFDLKGLNPDYVFYSRPYNQFMPSCYNSAVVSKYSKICIIIYGMSMTKEVSRTVLDRDFFKDVYCYFAESNYIKRYNKRQFRVTHFLRLRKTLYLGNTALQQIKLDAKKKNHAWDFTKTEYRILWTPRWTTDLKLGGSNFFEYHKLLLNYAIKNPQTAFLFRPHPLMFRNFIATGEMNEEQVENFEAICDSIPNIQLDKEKEYVATMWESNMLITDISGILPEYFITGKPIIYCANNMVLTPAPHTKKILSGCYIVKTEDELIACIDKISRGEDELKDKRKEIIEVLWGKYLDSAAQKITDFIVS